MLLVLYLWRIHHQGGADLSIEVRTKIDGGQFVQLGEDILWQVHQFHVPTPPSTFPIEAFGYGVERSNDDVLVLITQIPEDLQHLSALENSELLLLSIPSQQPHLDHSSPFVCEVL